MYCVLIPLCSDVESMNSTKVAAPKKQAVKMQTFSLGGDGVFGGVAPAEGGGGPGKGERMSPCGQFLIDSDGNWKPNTANPPSRQGARDPTDPLVSKREAVKFGRRSTPVGGSKKVHRPPSDSSYDTML